MSHQTHTEPATSDSTLNWLRAAVLGANDGIVSTASLVVGVAAGGAPDSTLLLSGVAGMFAGACAMAAGEYVSVSTQRDAEEVLLKKERYEMKYAPEEEKRELAAIYIAKGLSQETADRIAHELSTKNALKAHIEAELHINPDDLTNPWHAAWASAAAFVSGALIPLLTVYFVPAPYKIPTTFISVVAALALAGYLSAHVGNSSKSRATIRLIAGGCLAMTVTYAAGALFHVSGL